MGFDEFVDLAADVVTVERFVAEDGYGVATYEDAVETPARVELGPKLIVNATGLEIVSTCRVYLGIAIDIRDRLTLPDDAPNRTPSLLRVEPVRDESGPHHWVAYA
jgi:hypothetical protein